MNATPAHSASDAPARSAMPTEWLHPDGRAPTGAGVVVAMIDSGWDRTSSNPRVVAGVGFVDPDDDFRVRQTVDDHDRIGHGTACANLLLAVAPEVDVVPVRVFGGRLETSPETVEAAIDWAIARRVDVINLSLSTVREDARDRFYLACDRARAAGSIVVAAVSHAEASYPSAFDLVLSVGMGEWDDPLRFTYHPDQLVECRSPGRGRQTIGVGGRSVTVSGTSFATPNIAGIVALWRERWPGLDLLGVRDRLAKYAGE